MFTITNVSDTDIDLTVVSNCSGYFELDLPDKIASGESAKCKLKVYPEYLDQKFEKSFTIELGDVSKSRFTIPVQRRLIGGGAVKQSASAQKTSGGK